MTLGDDLIRVKFEKHVKIFKIVKSFLIEAPMRLRSVYLLSLSLMDK